MPTVPMDPSVDLSANPMGRFAAPDVAAPAVQQGPDYTGKQIEQAGAAAMTAGAAFVRIAERIQDDIDNTVTKEADNIASEKIRAEQTKYLSTRGKDAVYGLNAVQEKIKKDVEDAKAGLQNEMQRKMFSQVVERRLLAARTEMGAHQLKALKEWNFNETKSRVGNLMSDAITDAQNYAVPGSVYQERSKAMIDEVDDLAQQAGIVKYDGAVDRSSEQYKSMLRDTTTALHTTVLNGAINNDQLDFARDYLKKFRNEISPDKLNQIDKALDVGTFEAKTQQFAQNVWKQSGGDILKARELAREKYSGKEEDAVVNRLNVFEQEVKNYKTQQKLELGKQAWSFVMSGNKIPTTVVTQLQTENPEELRQIRDWQDAKRRQAKTEAEQGATYGLDQYYGLRRMAMDDPAAFTALDLRKFAPYMSKGQMEGLIDIQGGINKNDIKSMESSRVIKQTLGLIKSEVAAVGIDLTPKEGTPQAKETQQFMGALTQALDQATKEKGKPLTDDEAKRIGMSMLREGIEQGSGFFGFFQSKKRGYEMATDANIKPGANFIVKKYDDIPVNVRQELLRDYVGINPSALKRDSSGKYIMTDEAIAAIERAYTRGVNQGKFK